MNSKVSPYHQAETEFRDILNLNFATYGDLCKRQGTTLYVGATVTGRVTGLVEYQRLNGASYVVATANTTAYTVSGSFSPFKTGLLNNALFTFVTLVDRLFACNGQDYFRFDGSASSAYSLPPGITGFGVTAVIGGGLSGTFVAGYGYLNDRGYRGPVSNGLTITLNGITFGSVQYYGMTAQSGFGITAIALYRTSASGVDLAGTTFAGFGATTATDTGFTLTTTLANYNLYFTLVPRYLEIYNNQLFMAGFSSMPSTAWWSDIGEPEGVDPTFFAEFRTNDGDRITGMKAYNGALIVAKERSFHRLIGDNPSDFSLTEISDQYGCLSHRAMVTFEDSLWFLDSKGIVEYNGANVQIVSYKVESFFAAMNIAAARDNAIAVHNRMSNEIWFSIPCNGATLNNVTLVYDYAVKAWTRYEGFQPSSIASIQGNLTSRSMMYGGYTGSLFYFGSSFMGDNGQGITCSLQTHFHSPEGESSESQFRRFYLNLVPVLGITQPITVNLKTNYGDSTMISRTMYQNPFQSRVDFGLSARSIQAEVIHASASLPFQVQGYTFESRHQRAT